jgi:hypothetical protein
MSGEVAVYEVGSVLGIFPCRDRGIVDQCCGCGAELLDVFIVAGETYRGAIVILLVVIVDDRIEGEANVVEQAVVHLDHGLQCEGDDVH